MSRWACRSVAALTAFAVSVCQLAFPPRAEASHLGSATASAGSVVAIVVGTVALGSGTRMEGFNAMFLGSIALTMIWLVIGATLQRLPALTEPGNGADGLVGEVVSA